MDERWNGMRQSLLWLCIKSSINNARPGGQSKLFAQKKEKCGTLTGSRHRVERRENQENSERGKAENRVNAQKGRQCKWRHSGHIDLALARTRSPHREQKVSIWAHQPPAPSSQCPEAEIGTLKWMGAGVNKIPFLFLEAASNMRHLNKSFGAHAAIKIHFWRPNHIRPPSQAWNLLPAKITHTHHWSDRGTWIINKNKRNENTF